MSHNLGDDVFDVFSMMDGSIPLKLNRKGVYELDKVRYKQMMRAYQPRGPIHFHTFESVAADILKERARGRYAQ